MLREINNALFKRGTAGKRIVVLENQMRSFLRKNPDFIGIRPRAWSFGFAQDLGGRNDVLIRWVGDTLRIEMNTEVAHYLHHTREKQLFTVIVWMMLAGPDAEYITFNLSDGEAPSAARFAYSASNPQVITLPDQYFFENRGFVLAKNIAAKAPTWADRSDEIVWRGGAVGTGVGNPHAGLARHPSVTQRIRLAHLAKGTEVDFAFVPVDMTIDIWPLLRRAGLTDQPIPEDSWAGRKYAIDIDGFTNTWSNLFIRLAFGCCVFKVESQFGYRQWYYDNLQAWENYIPVKADLSDLFTQIAWARDHPRDCARIAAQGQALVQGMTFESESKVAADAILNFWDGKEFDDAV